MRLDRLMVEKGLAPSRQRAQAMIMAGNVLVNSQLVEKSGYLISESAEITLKGEVLPYVSRGGLKLEKALESFAVSVEGLVCLDVGASTGGFTDCLLQHGAARVYAVDVGYGQLAWQLRQDSRVIPIERMNIRNMPLNMLPEPVDLVTIDVSFISLKIVVPAVMKFIRKPARIIALIKPQFEVGKGKVGKGGVVRDPLQHESVIEELQRFFKDSGWICLGVVPSPILGPSGNREFLIHLSLMAS
ncbi:MAG: TlyA family RNA methyltransferase [Deltaproteobacteria bacterium]|nr:TlyA family RNA methyltransferase [Deltaproteobacteria bacterium]